MNLIRTIAVTSSLFFSITGIVSAQQKAVFKDKEVVYKKGLKLTFINQDKSFSPVVKQRMIGTFFKVYPALKAEYNEKTAKEVTFVIDTTYKGVAATQGTIVAFSPVWFRQHPGDIDVVTHEVMHIVQNYGSNAGPWWITEGIADYVRYQYGVDNAGAKWTLPDYKSGQNYDNGYRITARFLAWLEKHEHQGIVKNLDQQMRAHTYKEEFWKTQTTKTLPELWAAYVQNPII
ncbi:basic secretory protein-like protein [Pedobacter cryoconitis]|uniref:Basic secretory peptidase family protein n=1 Tax=Pedobacter cryoconitis TaxID=188932 RepID=A0A327T958_9SPHI|nr:basic secretory protein-like protein [Pedobacter cryoconitis]RAJ37482.1 basic secretory peptidase family protein [Pedobacter cryoconitis]